MLIGASLLNGTEKVYCLVLCHERAAHWKSNKTRVDNNDDDDDDDDTEQFNKNLFLLFTPVGLATLCVCMCVCLCVCLYVMCVKHKAS